MPGNMEKAMKIIIMALVATLLLSSGLSALRLEWVIPQNERLEIVRTASVGYFINKKLEKEYDERNIINLTCYSQVNDKSNVKGDFTVFMKEKDEQLFKQLEKHITDFAILKNGRFIIDNSLFMPNLRHLPAFPEKDLTTGEEWTAPAELYFTNFSRPFMINFNVKYKIVDLKNLEGKDVAVVDYMFTMDRSFNTKQVPEDMPFRIIGKNKGRMMWDVKGQKPHLMDDEYRIVFVHKMGLSSIGSTEFVMNIATRYKMYTPVSPDEKSSAVKELEKELPKDSGISVDQDKRGIVLRLGEVLFDFDSYRLRGGAEKNLEKVSDLVLKKYSDREVLVEGHTDNVGNSSYNQKLSEQRAHSVAKYLKNRGNLDKLSYRGFGEDKPIANNSTGEGRKKNRRVEVIINLK
jgi:outer membrane protein OmpA-like peptidoglycan-associated protein